MQRVIGIGGREAQRSSADRPDRAAHQREAVGRPFLLLPVERKMEEERLDVGSLETRRGPPEQLPVQLL